jgi:hypothetical protein
MFTPFDIMYRKVWVKDGFIYPQLYLVSVVLTFFSMLYLGYKTISLIFNLADYIDDSYDRVYTSTYTFMRTGLEGYFTIFKYEPTQNDFFPYFDQLETVGNAISELVIAIKIGAYIALILSTVSVFANFVWMSYDYRKRVMDARIGIFGFNPNKIPIRMNSILPAAIISNSVFLFFLVLIVLTLA